MEGIGIDIFSLASEMGWDTYPLGKTCLPRFTHGNRMGLILIAFGLLKR